MWCPSVSLSVWSNAWLAGHAAPDDVLDALSAWAPIHSVTAYDAVAAGRTGLPWPDVDSAGAMSLLQTVRTVAGPRMEMSRSARPAIDLVLPVPGDVRGLPAGTQFQRDSLDVGEAIVVRAPEGEAIGLVPAFECSDDDDSDIPEITVLSWSVYSLPGGPAPDHFDLGDAEYALRSAVRSAAEALGSLQPIPGCEDPRTLVEELLQAGRLHRIPDHAPDRALRVLSTAAHVDAIITVSAGPAPIATQSASEEQIAGAAIRPLATVVRAARTAAVSAILQSAWN
ncbi:hypothetical protein [Mycolicibacterium sp.]|uniref:hypothetical protein n=1 Tax=Mycolicibacterium sp. TaxID=2320850 RepID=UPI001A2EBBB9|nr:hypothetical protein [Mycolicibacterium sp.]MBJ7399441.1 hypothetical protein [Mycolicibacterium sp.]